MHNLFKFNSFFKFLDKNRMYTFIELFGMSVSFMFVILIAAYTYQEMSTDRFQEKADRLYILGTEESLGFAYGLGEHLKNRFPEIESVCHMVNYYKDRPVKLLDKKLSADLLMVDANFFDMFSFRVLEGDRVNPMEAVNHAVISRSFADKAFPGTDPMGEVIELEESVKVIVNGIMEDIENSTIYYSDIVIRIENLRTIAPWETEDDMHSFGGTPIMLLAKEGTNIQAKTEDMLAFLKEIVWAYREEMYTEFSLIPIREVYFSPIKGNHYIQGDRTFVLILISVGLLILIFAITNYVNLTVAQTGFRAKEMATRRLLGSTRGELFTRLIAESTLLSFISFLVGLFLAFLVIPFVNDLLATTIHLGRLITPINLLLAGLVILGMGTISGLIPAIIISNTKPVEVVKGTFRHKTKMVYSKGFITFQNIITIALVTTSITMILQINHLIKAPLGYKTTNIMDVPVSALRSKEQALLIKKEIEQLGVVNRVGLSRGLPFERGNNYTLTHEGSLISFQMFCGDSAFVHILGFNILKDNNLAPGTGFYLSERSFRALGINEDSPSFLFEPFYMGPQSIAGVIKDFQLHNILYEESPLLLRIQHPDQLEINNLVVEVQGNTHLAQEQIKQIYERITGLEFPGKYIEQKIEHSFALQRRMAKIIVLFSGVAILLSLLGLLAMSTYFILQRSREIAVRKVFGSSNLEVLKKLVSTFLSYVLIAFVIVAPFTWYFLQQWLAGYSYRISLQPWVFVVSGLFCLFVAFCTVFRQSWMAANSNPVDSIKAE